MATFEKNKNLSLDEIVDLNTGQLGKSAHLNYEKAFISYVIS